MKLCLFLNKLRHANRLYYVFLLRSLENLRKIYQ